MTHAEIAASYSDQALSGIIRDLEGKGWKGVWAERLQAAKLEKLRREIRDKQQDQQSIL